MNRLTLPFAAASAFALAACSASETTDVTGPAATESAAAITDDSALDGNPSAGPVTSGTPAGAGASTNDKTLALEGLGDLVVGKPVPAGSSFAERGAQVNDTCRTISSSRYPGVYAIVENGQVRRITVGERSDVKLVEGIGVGTSEKDLLAAFPGFRSTAHKYVEAPAKYLDQPGNDPRLRFEIGQNGRVSLIHVGLMPQLGYVEGCS